MRSAIRGGPVCLVMLALLVPGVSGAAADPYPPLDETAARVGAPGISPESELSPSYTRAYVALGVGAGLTIGSFLLAESADRAYGRYQVATDPAAIEDAYQDAKQLDRLSAACLIVGNAGLVLGLYWRFVKTPTNARSPARTSSGGLDPILVPTLTPDRVGLAVTVSLP